VFLGSLAFCRVHAYVARMTAPTPTLGKPKKPTPREQSERFKKTARELGCDETPGALDRAFGKIVGPKKIVKSSGRRSRPSE